MGIDENLKYKKKYLKYKLKYIKIKQKGGTTNFEKLYKDEIQKMKIPC